MENKKITTLTFEGKGFEESVETHIKNGDTAPLMGLWWANRGALMGISSLLITFYEKEHNFYRKHNHWMWELYDNYYERQEYMYKRYLEVLQKDTYLQMPTKHKREDYPVKRGIIGKLYERIRCLFQ